jgi:hypothetical protein
LKISLAENGSLKISFAEIGSTEIGFAEVGSAEISFAEIGSMEIDSVEIGFMEIGFVEIGFVEIDSTHIDSRSVSNPEKPTVRALFEFAQMLLISHETRYTLTPLEIAPGTAQKLLKELQAAFNDV